jgi:hypothetical protein
VSDEPNCPTCKRTNCVACLARELRTRISTVYVELPQLSAEQRQRDRDAAPAAALQMAVLEALAQVALNGLAHASSGRYALCVDHALPDRADPARVERVAAAVRDVGVDAAPVIALMTHADPAVLRHTLQRFARLWHEIRVAGVPPDSPIEGSDLAIMCDELDELARGVLS